MRLSLGEAAELLGAPEAILEDWVVRRGLPAFRIHERLWVNRAELLEWAAARGIRFSSRLYTRGTSDLAAALERGGVHRDLPAESAEAALRALAKRLPLLSESETELLLDIIVSREVREPTIVAPGLLLPHARMPAVLDVDQPLLAVGYPSSKLRIGKQEVHTIFMLITPNPRSHLEVLARLARALHDPAFLAALAEQVDLATLLALVESADGAVSVR